MRAEIVGVGTEILLGQITNSNAQWMSQRLAEIGVDVLHHQVVGDNVQRIAEALGLALSRSEAVLATGGLGPTQDDVTREAISLALDSPLVRRPEIEEFLREKFRNLGREMPQINLVQADVPEGGRYILPQRGTAPGLACARGDRVLYAVPGVPAEMREMMTGTILPELSARSGTVTLASRVLRCTGIAEAKVAERLDDLFASSRNPTVAYLASSGEVKVRLTAKAVSRAEAEDLIRPVAEEVERRLAPSVFTTHDEELEEAVGRRLHAARATVATAESLTGGGVAARLTRVPGASEYFVGSAVCYTAEAKRTVLGVSPEVLDGPGIVSEECARAMAAGARRLFGADLAVALTGVAGPEAHGGQPPGQVWVALETAELASARGFRAPGDRGQVRRWAEQAALDMLRRHLDGSLAG